MPFTLDLAVLSVNVRIVAESGDLYEACRASLAYFVSDAATGEECVEVVRVAETGDAAVVRYGLSQAVLEKGTLVRALPDILTLLVMSKVSDLLFLHASAVEIDGQSIIFVGASMTGKSTTAAALHQYGGRILSDDLVPLHRGSLEASAYPTSQNFRKFTQVLSREQAWDVGYSHLKAQNDGSSFPIRSIYLLQPRTSAGGALGIPKGLPRKKELVRLFLGSDAVQRLTCNAQGRFIRDETDFSCAPEIFPCRTIDAVRSLVNHLYTPNRALRELLADMAELSSRVPVHVLRPGRLDEMLPLLWEHIGSGNKERLERVTGRDNLTNRSPNNESPAYTEEGGDFRA